MIHVITVLAGTSSHDQVAQRHAIRMAQLFGARLRVATIWGPESANEPQLSGRTWETLADEEVERISRMVGDADIPVERSLRGEGLFDGLMAEARETDLLVVGLPECPKGDEPVCRAIRHDEMPLLHKAECLVLVVHRDPAPIKRVLVDYHGGTEGKAALRAAGEMAVRTSAAVTALCVNGSRENAQILTGSARRYLEGFGISGIASIVRVGQPGSETEVFHASESAGADFIVISGDGHGMLDWLRGRAASQPEELSTALHRPVLIVR
jgi:hypothetical protein